MPRLTAKQYLRSHDQLRRFWLRQPRLFTALSPLEQWALHDFFQPSKDLADRELLEHRQQVSAERPSLPQQAGRALALFHERTSESALDRVRVAKLRPGKASRYQPQRDRVLSVAPLMRPEIDLEKLSSAFIGLARLKMQQRQTRKPKLGRAALTSMGAVEPPADTPTWPLAQYLLEHPGPEPYADMEHAFDWL